MRTARKTGALYQGAGVNRTGVWTFLWIRNVLCSFVVLLVSKLMSAGGFDEQTAQPKTPT
jgi:hypothetical protein